MATGLFLLASVIPVESGTTIKHDPNGFYGIPWGTVLAERDELKKIDSSNTLHIFTLKTGAPVLAGIPMKSVKLYTLKDQYARALFHYQGTETHHSLLQYLQTQFGKTDQTFGNMVRGLNQHYTWRGNDTEITLSYHGFRERGLLTAESRVLAPLFLDVHGDHSF